MDLQHEIDALRMHPVFARMASVRDVRSFVEQHAFAVWNAMSLLKGLQRELSCVSVPWVPRGDALSRRLVNEMVLVDESDSIRGGGYASRFEIYRAAMEECGADGSRLDAFVARVRRGESIPSALALADAPSGARRGVLNTWDVIQSRSLPRLAGAFTLGQAECVTDSFRAAVSRLEPSGGVRFELLTEFLDRHAQLERERAAARVSQLLESVCGDDEQAWEAARTDARGALQSRRAWWTEIAGSMSRRPDLERAGGESAADRADPRSAPPPTPLATHVLGASS